MVRFIEVSFGIITADCRLQIDFKVKNYAEFPREMLHYLTILTRLEKRKSQFSVSDFWVIGSFRR